MSAVQTSLRYAVLVVSPLLLFATTVLRYLSRDASPRELVSHAVRFFAVFSAAWLFTALAASNPRQPAYPLSVAHLNNATLSFETVVVLTSKPAFKQKKSIYFSLPPYENGILHVPEVFDDKGKKENDGILHGTPLLVEPSAPKRKGHTAALTRVVEKGFSTALILEEKIGINARFREELYWVHRALRAQTLYEDMQMSDLHKLKGYWDEPDAVIAIGPQPNYSPYYRAPPSIDTKIDDFAFEKLVTGKGLGRVKDRQQGVGKWDLIFLGDCKEQFDEEAQKKLRSQNKEKTPWRRMDWVAEPGQTSDLWVPELTEADLVYARQVREKKRETGKVGEKEMLGQGLRKSESVQDACILGYVVSQRGALKLQKHFGASDPGLGTQDLMSRFCGGSDNVCFVLGEGVVRERKQD